MSTQSILSLLQTSGLMELTRQQLKFLMDHQAEISRNDRETLKQIWELDLKRVAIYEGLLPNVGGDELEYCKTEVESILFGGARTLAQAGAKSDDLKDIFGEMKKRFDFIDLNEIVEHAAKSLQGG